MADIPLLFVSSVGYLGWSCRPENHGMTNEPCIEPWIQMMSVTIKKNTQKIEKNHDPKLTNIANGKEEKSTSI